MRRHCESQKIHCSDEIVLVVVGNTMPLLVLLSNQFVLCVCVALLALLFIGWKSSTDKRVESPPEGEEGVLFQNDGKPKRRHSLSDQTKSGEIFATKDL